ncbi:uncharacterized protein LOC135093233 [Scylla paramamosain]|uniref:uncharacterized protein LOC135093233 n=1 Tax=Scylla paramamosain TaxID=85552 RepID=UPI003083CF9C
MGRAAILTGGHQTRAPVGGKRARREVVVGGAATFFTFLTKFRVSLAANMPILGSCCICLDLKVGTKIIGILNLIGAIFSSLSMAISLVMVMFLDAGVSTAKAVNEIHRSRMNDDDYMDTQDQPKQIMELVQEHLSYVKIALYVMLALALLLIITSSMLIHGVRRDRRGLLLPFIVQQLVNIVVFVGLDIAVLVLFGAHKVIIGSVLSMLVGCLIQLYLVLVVVSQYQALGLIRMHEEISMK